MMSMEIYPDLDQWMIGSTGAVESLVPFEEGISEKCHDGNLNDIGDLNQFSKISSECDKFDLKLTRNEEISLNTLGTFAEWMDEKTDLSIIDCPEDWQTCLNDQTETAINDSAAALLDSLMDNESCPFNCDDLFDVLPEKPVNNLIDEIFFPEPLTPPKSPEGVVPEVTSDLLCSPSVVVIDQSNAEAEDLILPYSPTYKSVDEMYEEPQSLNSSVMSSPASLVHESSELAIPLKDFISTNENVFFEEIPLEEEQMLVESESKEIKCIDLPHYSAGSPSGTHLATIITIKVDPQALLIQDSEKCTVKAKNPRKKRVSSYIKKTKRLSRRERKKKQNKEAAARYRIKKRAESGVLQKEADILVERNKELNEKVVQLSSEISYLKGLMREVFKAKGLLK